MNKSNISKFCHNICHIFGENVVKECQKYIGIYNIQPIMGNIYHYIFNFCEDSKLLNRLWAMYKFAKLKSEKLCSQKCRDREVDSCIAYVEGKIMENSMDLLKKYNPNKGAKETTYIYMIVNSRVVDFCRMQKNHQKFDENIDQSRIIDRVKSIEDIIIEKSLIDKVIDTAIRLNEEQKLSSDELLVLKLFLEGYEFGEMATLLDVKTKDIYALKDRAIKKIEKKLQENR